MTRARNGQQHWRQREVNGGRTGKGRSPEMGSVNQPLLQPLGALTTGLRQRNVGPQRRRATPFAKKLEEIVAKWRQTFEALLPLRPEWQQRQVYLFGRPATEAQLTQVETELAVRLPDDLREMLREFNGV